MSSLGVAVVGCGFQGRIHARNVAASSGAELLWCVDTDLNRAATLAEEMGAVGSTDRVADVWCDSLVDLVIIATTTDTHHRLALAAAGSGKHMLIEKPMALTIEECLEVERAVDESGVAAAVGYKFRFTDAVRKAREAIPDPGILVAQTLYDPAPAGTNHWVNDRSVSGGRLVSSLVHAIDLLRFLSSDEIVSVSAEGASITETDLEDPDTAVVSLRFSRGAIGTIVHGTAAASGLLSTWSFQVARAGVHGTIHDHCRRLLLRRVGESDTTVTGPAEDPFEAGTAPLLEALLHTIDGGDVAVPGPRDGTISLLVARCIEDAIRSHQPIGVPSL